MTYCIEKTVSGENFIVQQTDKGVEVAAVASGTALGRVGDPALGEAAQMVKAAPSRVMKSL